MKKIVITSLILVLVMMFVGTCEAELPEEEVKYTDVVYSPDGSEITLYLDGVGVPVTQEQRAINRELATMAYDFFEVLFVSTNATTATNLARTSWELGQPAGIANVPRGSGTTGINYAFTTAKATTPVNLATMFVGKKGDKTLLGIGHITSTRYTTAPAADPTTTITEYTTSVTFSVAALQSGLLIGTETIAGTHPAGVMEDSFKYTTGGDTTISGYTARSATNSVRSSVNGSPLSYPRYSLPQDDGKTVHATYTFSHVDYNGTTTGGTNEFFPLARVINLDSPATPPRVLTGHSLVQKRVPRFMSGGRYMEPKEAWTTTTTVAFGAVTGAGNYLPTGGIANQGAFNPVVGLIFTMRGSGVFSFYLQIPVCMVTDVTAEFNGTPGVPAELWYIRTGVGSELYSLDDGIANGGCVFMSVGASAANWMDIEWVWL